jgi:protein-tyrosine-phosphatase
MAAALLERRAGDRVSVRSAGSEPAEIVNPAAVAALAEWGIDIAGESPEMLNDETAREADVIVTMGCGDSCPVYPGKRYLDWELDDPAGKSIEEVRLIRDEISSLVDELAQQLLDDSGGRGSL